MLICVLFFSQIIEGGTKKGGELLVDSDGFTYPLKRDNNRGKTWICSARHKKCPAKVLRLMGSKQFVRNGRKHTHLPNPKSIRFSETCEFLDQEPNGNVSDKLFYLFVNS